MLEMSASFAILGAKGVAVFVQEYLFGTFINHRLNRNHHARAKRLPLPLFAKVGDIGVLVDFVANPVSGKLAHDAVSIGLDTPLDGITDVSRSMSGFDR